MSESLSTYFRVKIGIPTIPDVQHVVRCSTQVNVLRQQRKEWSLLFPTHCVRPVQLDLCLTNSWVVLELRLCGHV